jgi:hypothetical protein
MKKLNKRTKAHHILIDILKEDYSLTEREIMALTLVPFLTGKEVGSLDIFQCSPTRVRQIYQQALRKLQHPSRMVKWSKKCQTLLDKNSTLINENQRLVKIIAENNCDQEILERYNRNMSHIFSCKVKEYDFSVRVQNCFAIENIVYIGDLVQKTDVQLIRYTNFGRKSLDEVMNILNKLRLHLNMDTHGWIRPQDD